MLSRSSLIPLARLLGLGLCWYLSLAGAAAADGYSLAPKESAAWAHAPYEAGECGLCHEGEDPKKPGPLVAPANDLCLDCHSRYQGPFVFEHAPVTEDCTICHDPHGSVANNLLVQNEPFLCLQCHEGHFHLLRQGFEPGVSNIGSYTVPGNDGTPGQRVTGNLTNGVPAGAVDPAKVDAANPHGIEGWQMSFGTKCTTCHAVVHGSDFPSQPLSGGGLTR